MADPNNGQVQAGAQPGAVPVAQQPAGGQPGQGAAGLQHPQGPGQGPAQGPAQGPPQPQAQAAALGPDQEAVLNFLTHFGAFVIENKEAHNNAHIQTATHQELEAAREDERDRLRKIQQDNLEADTWARDIAKCDGKSAASIRTWIEEVAQALNHTDAVARLAVRTTTGPLRKDLECYMGSGDRSRFTWDDIKRYVVRNFMSDQDKEELRAEVEVMCQKVYETTKDYGRRYRDAVDLAYPLSVLSPQNDIADRYILGGYVRGLLDRKLAERLVRKGLPDTLHDTIKEVAKMEDAEKGVKSMFKVPGPLPQTQAPPPPARQEEPMEIDALAGPQASNAAPSPLEKEVANMKRQMTGITGQLTQLLAAFTNAHIAPQPQAQAAPSASRAPRPQHHRQPAANRPPTNFEFSEDGRPICAYCQKKGHLRRECRKRASDNARRNQVQGGQ